MQEGSVTIGDFATTCYVHYGFYVNNLRHIPNFYDGLKPVYTRTILAAYDLTGDRLRKKVQLMGETTGHYHPHGETSVEPVIDVLAHQGIFDSHGNFGLKGMLKDWDCPSAAPRYTEVKLNSTVRSNLAKLLPYVPEFVNPLGYKEKEYIPYPYPLSLQIGISGIGIGTTQSTPAFTGKSLAQAAVASMNKDITAPWEFLEANYQLSITNEDKKHFWFNPKGRMTYKFKVEKGKSGNLSGFYIRGEADFVRPNLRKLMELRDLDGRIMIRDESSHLTGSCVFIARQARVRSISEEEVEQLVYEAAKVSRSYNLKVHYKDVIRPIAGGEWIKGTLTNFNLLVKEYRKDNLYKVGLDIIAYTHFKELAKLLIDTKLPVSEIAKKVGVPEIVVEKVGKMTVNALRTTDSKKKLEKLREQEAYFKTLKTVDVVKGYIV